MRFDPCFDRRKVDVFRRRIPAALLEIEKLAGRRVSFPQYVHCMTEAEIAEGRRHGAGHGLYVGGKVKINASMDAENVFLNFVHENLHHAFPRKSEAEIDRLTDVVLARVRKANGKKMAKSKYSIASPQGPTEVEGDLVGPYLAVRKLTGDQLRKKSDPPWALDHVPSGLRVATFYRKNHAVDVAKSIAHVVSDTYLKDQKKVVDGLQENKEFFDWFLEQKRMGTYKDPNEVSNARHRVWGSDAAGRAKWHTWPGTPEKKPKTKAPATQKVKKPKGKATLKPGAKVSETRLRALRNLRGTNTHYGNFRKVHWDLQDLGLIKDIGGGYYELSAAGYTAIKTKRMPIELDPLAPKEIDTVHEAQKLPGPLTFDSEGEENIYFHDRGMRKFFFKYGTEDKKKALYRILEMPSGQPGPFTSVYAKGPNSASTPAKSSAPGDVTKRVVKEAQSYIHLKQKPKSVQSALVMPASRLKSLPEPALSQAEKDVLNSIRNSGQYRGGGHLDLGPWAHIVLFNDWNKYKPVSQQAAFIKLLRRGKLKILEVAPMATSKYAAGREKRDKIFVVRVAGDPGVVKMAEDPKPATKVWRGLSPVTVFDGITNMSEYDVEAWIRANRENVFVLKKEFHPSRHAFKRNRWTIAWAGKDGVWGHIVPEPMDDKLTWRWQRVGDNPGITEDMVKTNGWKRPPWTKRGVPTPTRKEVTDADLRKIKVLYRKDDTMGLWGIPYVMRRDVGQSPRDLWKRRDDVKAGKWIWLGSPGWYGSMTKREQERVKKFLAKHKDEIPGGPNEWSELEAGVREKATHATPTKMDAEWKSPAGKNYGRKGEVYYEWAGDRGGPDRFWVPLDPTRRLSDHIKKNLSPEALEAKEAAASAKEHQRAARERARERKEQRASRRRAAGIPTRAEHRKALAAAGKDECPAAVWDAIGHLVPDNEFEKIDQEFEDAGYPTMGARAQERVWKAAVSRRFAPILKATRKSFIAGQKLVKTKATSKKRDEYLKKMRDADSAVTTDINDWLYEWGDEIEEKEESAADIEKVIRRCAIDLAAGGAARRVKAHRELEEMKKQPRETRPMFPTKKKPAYRSSARGRVIPAVPQPKVGDQIWAWALLPGEEWESNLGWVKARVTKVGLLPSKLRTEEGDDEDEYVHFRFTDHKGKQATDYARLDNVDDAFGWKPYKKGERVVQPPKKTGPYEIHEVKELKRLINNIGPMTITDEGEENIYFEDRGGRGKFFFKYGSEDRRQKFFEIINPPKRVEKGYTAQVILLPWDQVSPEVYAYRKKYDVFRAPHHTVSRAGLIGSGDRKGEVQLASGGVLVLDDILEFPLANVEAIKHAGNNEDVHVVGIVDATELEKMPADFRTRNVARVNLMAKKLGAPIPDWGAFGWAGEAASTAVFVPGPSHPATMPEEVHEKYRAEVKEARKRPTRAARAPRKAYCIEQKKRGEWGRKGGNFTSLENAIKKSAKLRTEWRIRECIGSELGAIVKRGNTAVTKKTKKKVVRGKHTRVRKYGPRDYRLIVGNRTVDAKFGKRDAEDLAEALNEMSLTDAKKEVGL